MKILCVTTSYPLRRSPASGVFVKRLVESLREKGHMVQVLTPADGSGEITPGVETLAYAPRQYCSLAHSAGGIPERLRESRINYVLLFLMLIALLVGVNRKIKVTDVVLANWSLSGFAAVIGAGFSGVPVVTVLRGSDVNKASHGIGKWVLYVGTKFSKTVVCVSPSMKSSLLKIFPYLASKTVVIENGVDSDVIDKSIDTKNFLDEAVKLVIVGNLTSNKGISTIIEALQIVKEAGYHFIAKFIGGGSLADAGVASLPEELIKNVEFVGAIPHDKVRGELAISDLFINASFSEGRSNALLEALVSGLPVIASDIASNRELLSNGRWGTLFNVGDASDLANKLISVFITPDPALVKAAAAQQALRAESRSWAYCAHCYSDLFKRLA